MPRDLLYLTALTLLGCVADPAGAKPDPGDGTAIQPCAAPVPDGPARFVEEGEARGLRFDRPAFWGDYTSFDAGLVLNDLDADGDVDVALGRVEGAPDLFTNDGTGHFTRASLAFPDVLDRFPAVLSTGATDLDGDGLPELLMVGIGGIMIAKNLGEMRFEAPETTWLHPGTHVPFYPSYALGELDHDDDLDLVLPGIDWLPVDLGEPTDASLDQVGSPVQLLINQGTRFETGPGLTPDGTAGYSMYAVVTDRNEDGRVELIVSSVKLDFLDRSATQAVYREQDGVWYNEALALHLNLSVSGMGGDVIDLDHDGRLDYCISDTGPVKCFVASGDDTYYDVGMALGMVPAGWETGWRWSAWSIDVIDYDADGWYDMAIAAGSERHPREFWPAWSSSFVPNPDPEQHHDALLWGDGEGAFTDRAAEIGFDLPGDHLGLASADLDGDGWPEIVMAQPGTGAHVWRNQCGSGGWIVVDPRGVPENREAIGAVVTVRAGGIERKRQILALHGLAQGPSEAHFGLGDVDVIDEIEVLWPDGGVTRLQDVPARQSVVVER